jgi:hypothetical protein
MLLLLLGNSWKMDWLLCVQWYMGWWIISRTTAKKEQINSSLHSIANIKHTCVEI